MGHHTTEDLVAYFGIMIVMGMVRLPALADYWKRDPLFQCTIMSESMARDGFLRSTDIFTLWILAPHLFLLMRTMTG